MQTVLRSAFRLPISRWAVPTLYPATPVTI